MEDKLKELQMDKSRYRKLFLCTLALLLVHTTQIIASKEVTWPVVAVDSVVVLAFVSSNVLNKLVESEVVKAAINKVKSVVGK